MDYPELLSIWKAYDQKLEENLQLNRRNAEDITRIKVQSLLSSMKPIKIFTIIAGIFWVGFLLLLEIKLFNVASPFFLFSAALLAILNLAAITIYLYQTILIHEADISEPIVVAQERIARLQSSTIWVARLLFLQLPLWTIFYLNKGMLATGNFTLYIVQVFVTLSFTWLAIWLFRNINYRNRDKKWFRFIFSGSEWTPVLKAMEMLRQLEATKMDQ